MIPKVEIEAGKADLIREILGVNDLRDINLLDEYRDIFIKSQKSAYENESVKVSSINSIYPLVSDSRTL